MCYVILGIETSDNEQKGKAEGDTIGDGDLPTDRRWIDIIMRARRKGHFVLSGKSFHLKKSCVSSTGER